MNDARQHIEGLHRDGVEPLLRGDIIPNRERTVDERRGLSVGIAKPVEMAQLAPLPTPATRASRFFQSITERNWWHQNPALTGERTIPIQTGSTHDPLQLMEAVNKYRLNTFRATPEPWDEGLFG